MAVVATLSKGYDLDYIWKQVDRGPLRVRRPGTIALLSRPGYPIPPASAIPGG